MSARIGILGLVVVPLLTACGPPIAVKRLGALEVQHELTATVLSTGTPSTSSRIELQQRGLAERYQRQPAAVLAELHYELGQRPADSELLFALAELSFDHARRGGGQPYYLASTLYAWSYLFGPGAEARLDPLDPRGRLCANLYNVGLARAFESASQGGVVVLEAGERSLPYGTLDVALDPDALRWGNRRLVRFVSASELAVSGLRNRYRTWGIGAPLNAETEPFEAQAPSYEIVVPRVQVPVTALLRPTGPGQARLEIYAETAKHEVEIDGRSVPLEFEPTSALASMLARAPIWQMGLRAFLSGEFVNKSIKSRLGGIQPFSPDRIPVVLVHGTASHPGYWAEMVNDLMNDPDVRDHYQLWVFTYDTANPILYSALMLREALTKTVDTFDPARQSPCLWHTVVIGHSQGGMLTKLTAVESGDAFWRNVSDEPFDEFEMSDETRDLLRRGVFISPLPFVDTLIFIATPHRGSFRAGGFARRLLQRLVHFPGDLLRTGTDLLLNTDAGRVARKLNRLPNSVDNMAPGSAFVEAYSALPIAPGVKAHSIVALRGDGAVETGNDGVVECASARIDGVASELVVRSGHSTQGTPQTIEEVRRILVEHAAAVFDGRQCRRPAAWAP